MFPVAFYRCFAFAVGVWLIGTPRAAVAAVQRASANSRGGLEANSSSGLGAVLTVTPSSNPSEWTARIENVSSRPFHMVTDARLLWFDVANSQRIQSCRLPADLRPAASTPLPKATLEPGDSVSYPIDPRFYCFSADEMSHPPETLQLTAHYGWRKERRSRRRGTDTGYVAWSDDQKAHEQDIVGNTVTFEPNPLPWKLQQTTPPRSLALQMVKGSDVRTERSVKATVRLKNEGTSPVEVYVRRALLTFQVNGPNGVSSCPSDGEFRHPARLGFTRLSPGASVTLVNRLVELCPRGTFTTSGIYAVSAVFDTDAAGGSVGLDAFTGELRTARAALVRVRHALHLVPNHRVPQIIAAQSTQVRAPARAPASLRSRRTSRR